MTLGQRLQTLRLAAGWSQEQMAERLAVTRQTVSKWERDLSVPDVASLALLSDLFEISLDELIRGEKAEPVTRMLDLEQMARENRHGQRRMLLAILAGICILLGGLALVFTKVLNAYILRLQYMLYRYMTVGEYVYHHAGFDGPIALSAAVLTAGVLLLLALLLKRKHT